jgi:hypothetical protein
MEYAVEVYETQPGLFWTRFISAFCATCGHPLMPAYHGNPRWIVINGVRVRVVQRYYKCVNKKCGNHAVFVARHPEIVPFKKYSKSTFARVAFLAHVKKWTVQQVLGDMPWLTQSACYEILNSFKAACRASADARIANVFPPGSKVRVSIDGMETEKGQPALYMVREVTKGILLAAQFFETASAEALHELLAGIEQKYGLTFAGFLSDKGTNIDAMVDTYYPGVPHQLDTTHFLANASKALETEDLALQTGLRKDIRSLSVLKTIATKQDPGSPDLAEKERKVLADTKQAVIAVANQKKKGLFDFPGLAIYKNLEKIHSGLAKRLKGRDCRQASRKFQVILGHLAEKLWEICEKYAGAFKELTQAREIIHPIFKAVTDSHPKHPRRAFEKVVKAWEAAIGDKSLPEKVRGMVEAALNVARSYGSKLFAWRKAGVPWHNNDHESFHHKKKRKYRQRSGTKCIGPTLELSGPEEMYVPLDLTEAEIQAIVDEVGSEEYRGVRVEMRTRAERRRFNRACRNDPVKVLKAIFKNLKVDH